LYRNVWKGISSSLNYVYLNQLYYFSKIIDASQETEYKETNFANLIATDFGYFYNKKFGEEVVPFYDNFREKKRKDIEIHEKTLKTGYELSNNLICSKVILYKTNFIDDIIDFLIYISEGEYIDGVKKDLIEYCHFQKKTLNKDIIIKLISNCVEISIIIIVNIINSFGDESRIFFLEKVFIYLYNLKI